MHESTGLGMGMCFVGMVVKYMVMEKKWDGVGMWLIFNTVSLFNVDVLVRR